MSGTATKAKAPKPAVKDSKGNELSLGVKVYFDESSDGKSNGFVTGIEYQRQRVVIQPGDETSKDKKVVRPAGKVRVEKNRSGKILKVERAVRNARKVTAKASA